MNNVVKSVKGTRDFYPEDMALRTWLYEHMRHVSESFGYQEWEAPILETFELYAAKSGEELVEKQSYVFEDRGGDKITLRPELTPSLARLVAARQNQLTYPLRWWSFGPFWRYERPQKGRSREFFQWNIDMIGERSPAGDAELAAIAATFLKRVGLKPTEAQILVNNRRLMDSQLAALEIGAGLRTDVIRLIDRRDKLSAEKWEAYAEDIGLSNPQIDGVKQLLGDETLWEKSDELPAFFKAVDAYGVSDFIKFAPHIIRGLDYYTGTVMEAWDTAGDFRALFGGGRYDDLVSAVGGQPVSAVGFAVGDVVISLLLEQLGRLPEFGNTTAEVFITIFNEETQAGTLALSQELRAAGLKVATYPYADKLGKQFKYADRIGANIVVVLGPDEIIKGEVSVKDMLSGDQQNIARPDTAKHIAKILESRNAS
ncbi:MAG: histidine--tRNA ligase [Anaerolineales bacterium]|nr:histidine--tRNA ligase [Anaerolineales bacterium]